MEPEEVPALEAMDPYQFEHWARQRGRKASKPILAAAWRIYEEGESEERIAALKAACAAAEVVKRELEALQQQHMELRPAMLARIAEEAERLVGTITGGAPKTKYRLENWLANNTKKPKPAVPQGPGGKPRSLKAKANWAANNVKQNGEEKPAPPPPPLTEYQLWEQQARQRLHVPKEIALGCIGKRCFPDHRRAKLALLEEDEHRDMHAYECECGQFHLGHIEKGAKKADPIPPIPAGADE